VEQPSRPGQDNTSVSLGNIHEYLHQSGWTLRNTDDRTSLWEPRAEAQDRAGGPVRVVLPTMEDFTDYNEQLDQALRAVAFVERRPRQAVLDDITFGGSDNLSVRLNPRAPSGEAPLGLAQTAVNALRNFVVGSAAGLDLLELVLPPRRPVRAESYADQARISTERGSFIVNLALPLGETDPVPQDNPGQPSLIDVQPQPYGRRVATRMRAIAQSATALARLVGDGDEPIAAFGRPRPSAPNATELSALADLGGGGSERQRYLLRFAQSPLSSVFPMGGPLLLPVTPAEQNVMEDAAEFLRTKQPRSNVTVIGLVVRLTRTSNLGNGDIVIQGVDDDSGTPRRFRMNLGEADYNKALNAHARGLQVAAVGDLGIRGNQRYLTNLTFDVVANLYEDE
jgi:hypothetical protein